MTSAIVTITERARAVVAFSDELAVVERQIEKEKARHAREIEVLMTKKQALETSIFRLSSN